MLCYECMTLDSRESPAVATCYQCGAATCREHTRVGRAFTEVHSPGSQLRESPGRRLYCSTCGAEPTPIDPMAGAGFVEG